MKAFCLLLCVAALTAFGSAKPASFPRDLEGSPLVLPAFNPVQAEQVLLSTTQDEAVDTSLPLSGQLFVILICTFALLGVVNYAIQQYKYLHGRFLPSEGEKQGQEHEISTFDKVFNDTTIANARNAMTFTPVVATLMVYLMFRAVSQDYDRGASDYTTLQVGMVFATVGILLQAADAFSVRVHSDVFGNLSESLGILAVYIGLVILLWGLFEVRIESIPMSVSSKCLASLTVLLLGTMVAIKVMEIKKRYVDTRSPVSLQAINDMFDETKLEDVRQTASFVPFFLVVLFYANFRYIEIGSLPYNVEVGLVGTTICIFVQTLIVVVKSYLGTFGRVLRGIAVLATFVFFIVAMGSLVHNDWPGPSVATSHALVILFAMSFLKVGIVILQEASQLLLSDDDERSHEKFARLTVVFQSMANTTALGEVICILLLFLHFRAAILLKQDVNVYIDANHGLEPMIFLATISIFVQMLIQLIEALFGVHPVMTATVTMAIAALNTGLVGIVYFIVA